MIEFTNVSKSYKDKLILRDINMTFSSGEFVAIIGSSGCGKTTLLKMINKLLPMDRGDIIIDGKSIREIPDIKLRREIGYVVQEGGLFPHFTVKENLEIVPQLEGLEPEKREQRINELLDMILKRLHPIAAKRNIELILEGFRPVDAEIDETKLSLAISNLVENAIKYNKDEGWVRVSLNADHKYFYVTVTDSGLGIPEESIDHIFERFYRVDKSHSTEIEGTGLGLAITRSAIMMHHGAIRVKSQVGEETTFSVRIPLTFID